MKTMVKLIAVLAIAGFMFASANEACAQGSSAKSKYNRRYQPNKPTLSPYLNYFRLNTGVLPNYQQFVRPQVQLQKTLQRQQTEIQSGKQGLQKIDQQLKQRFRQPTVSPTGHHATFMNFLHYFPKRNHR